MFYLLAYIIRGGINRHRQKDQNFHCNKELFHAPNKINIDKEQKKTVQSSTSSTHKNKKAKTHPHSQPVSAPPGKTRSSAPDGAPPHSTGTPAGTPPDSADRLFAKTAANPSNYLQKKKKPPPKPPEAQIRSQTTQSKNQTNRTQKPQSTRAKPTKTILALGVPNDGPRLVLVGDAEAGADEGESFHVHLLRRAAGVRRQRLGEEMPKKMAPFWAAMDTCVPAILTMGARAKETRTCGSGRAVRNRGRSG